MVWYVDIEKEHVDLFAKPITTFFGEKIIPTLS
jgi:hypothetical protein